MSFAISPVSFQPGLTPANPTAAAGAGATQALDVRALEPGLTGPPVGDAGQASSAFQSMLTDAIGSVDSAVQGGNQALDDLASGKNVDLHTTMIRLEKADITLKAAVAVRDKVVRAYETVMNMTL